MISGLIPTWKPVRKCHVVMSHCKFILAQLSIAALLECFCPTICSLPCGRVPELLGPGVDGQGSKKLIKELMRP